MLGRREIGWIRYLRGDVDGMTEESAQVVAAAEAAGDRFVTMQGLVAFGYSCILRARFADGDSAIRRAVAIAEQDEKAYWATPGSMEAVTSGKVGAHGITEAASRGAAGTRCGNGLRAAC